MGEAKNRVPYADKAEMAQKIADAGNEGGTGAAAEEAAGQGGAALARAGASAATGGISDAAGTVAPQINKAIDKVGDAVGRGTYKAAVAVAAAVGAVVLTIILLLTGGFTALVASVAGGAKPPPPTQEQCETMPENWCDVVYDAQTTTNGKTITVPWTVLAGLARVTTDYGRTSPYDVIDRDPTRVTPPYLATNFADTQTASSNVNLGTVQYSSSSLAWGGHQNGQIPAAALCAVPWAPGHTLECNALNALTLLNEKYKADHGGANIAITSTYRSLQGQVAIRNDWCAKGSCRNAAQPGTSNHGWGLAADFKNFGGINQYTAANYLWMTANAPTFGWIHPPWAQAGGKGPLEPWHWEFHGETADTAGAATVSQTAAWGRPDGLSAGASAASGSSCDVTTPTTAIGGEGRQASGPFLLLPAASAKLTKSGGDPQNPCDAAEFVAQALAEAAIDVRAEDGLPGHADTEAGAAFWQKVIKEAGVIADPDSPTGECTAPEGLTVDQMIDAIWKCELSQAAELHVVSGATTAPVGMKFTEYDRDTGQSLLIAEAKSVAWASSQYGAATCSETAEIAGVFPLTAKAASEVGVVERCDPQQNILGAAKLVVAGEAVPVADRSGAAFTPMLGGWANIPAALGPDASAFSASGPRRDPEVPAECVAGIDEYVLAAAKTGSPFAELADAAARPGDTGKFTSWLANVAPGGVLTACAELSDEQFAAQVVVTAQAHLTDQPGVAPTRPDENAVVDAPALPGYTDPSVDATTGESVDAADPAAPPATTPEPATPQPAAPPTAALDLTEQLLGGGRGYSVPMTGVYPDVDALLGLSAWFNWVVQDSATSTAAVFGQHSVVSRLSTTSNPAPTGPTTPVLTFASTPWQTRVTEWAVFYGGVTMPYDTHGERTGSLLSSLTGASGVYAPVAGDASGQAATVIEAAKRYLGTPYSWAGGGKAGPGPGTTGLVGFDCSGLTEYAFYQAGYEIGTATSVQKDKGETVSGLQNAQPGDLLFFGAPKIRHVAIYLGENMLIHAPQPGGVVNITSVYETPVLIKRVITARATTGTVDTWVATALQTLYANGFPQAATDAENLKLIIDKESSGNPAAVNNTDSNAAAGRPSFGLMQTIPTTFEAHALPGFTDKADPVAQIMAGARYAQSRYGGLANVPGVKAVAQGKAYTGY